ncbi:MAG: hypothetical protein WCW17_01795 [Patescibacteria group bacterium]|jgi:hypothetical protein
MKEGKSSLGLAALIIFLSLFGIGYGFYYMNIQSADLKDAKQKLEITKIENKALTDKKVALDAAAKKLIQKDGDLKLLKLAMPKGPNLSEALIESDSLFRSLQSNAVPGVQAKSFSVGLPVLTDGKIPVNISIDSDVNSLIAMIAKYYNNIRPFTVESINITSSETPIFTSNLQMNLSFVPTTGAVSTEKKQENSNQNSATE